MRSKIFIYVAVAAILFGCKKYPDGPTISLRTHTERISHTSWMVESANKNGNDITSTYTGINYTEAYGKDGTFAYTTSVGGGTGKWSFENSDTQIKRNGVSGQNSNDLTILELKQNAFGYKFIDGNDTYEFRLIPN